MAATRRRSSRPMIRYDQKDEGRAARVLKGQVWTQVQVQAQARAQVHPVAAVSHSLPAVPALAEAPVQ